MSNNQGQMPHDDDYNTNDSSYGNQASNKKSFTKTEVAYTEEDKKMFATSPVGFLFRNNIWSTEPWHYITQPMRSELSITYILYKNYK